MIFAYGTTLTETEHESEVTFTKDTPYLALAGELLDLFCEYLDENRPRYISTALCSDMKQILVNISCFYYIQYSIEDIYIHTIVQHDSSHNKYIIIFILHANLTECTEEA